MVSSCCSENVYSRLEFWLEDAIGGMISLFTLLYQIVAVNTSSGIQDPGDRIPEVWSWHRTD